MYPEHDKLREISDKSQIIGEFLDWMSYEKHIVRARWGEDEDGDDVLLVDNESIEGLLAEFFGIDRDKIEAEKLAMLETLRAD